MRCCYLSVAILLCAVFGAAASPAYAQTLLEEALSGPDAHEAGPDAHKYLFGGWGGERARLLKRGVKLDLHYLSDSLWNIESPEKQRFASFDRFRGTVDIDFGELVNLQGLSFHATAVWQGGGNLGSYLGLLSNPSSITGMNTVRLDSWWFEKRLFGNHVAARVGQFAGQDSYGDQDYGTSFVMEPIGGSLDNLSNTFESFDPPSTPAAELRVMPVPHFYVKSMVLCEDRTPYSNNPTGLVPQFQGTAVSVSEIGFTPGKKALATRPGDNTASRKGYSGLYRFGASYNPGKFVVGGSSIHSPGNYLLYWTASQAVWRADPKEAKGLDATLAYDWSPRRVNRRDTTLTAGLRFNEPLPLPIHNTMSLGYVQDGLSPRFLPAGMAPWKTERGAEFNILFNFRTMIILQPAVQYYANVGGAAERAVVLGFRTKVEF